jgi:hypothetical protein
MLLNHVLIYWLFCNKVKVKYVRQNVIHGVLMSCVQWSLNVRKKLVKCYSWSMAFCGAETWTLWKVDQKYLERFEMWCWRRMEKISWSNCESNEETLNVVKEERNTLHAIKRMKVY